MKIRLFLLCSLLALIAGLQSCTLLDDIDKFTDFVIDINNERILYTVPITDEEGPYTFEEFVNSDIEQDLVDKGYSPDALDKAIVNSVEFDILSDNPSITIDQIRSIRLRIRAGSELPTIDLVKGDLIQVTKTSAVLPVAENDIDVLPYLKRPRIFYRMIINLKDGLTVERPIDVSISPQISAYGTIPLLD